MKSIVNILIVTFLILTNLSGVRCEVKSYNAGFDYGYQPYEYLENNIPKGLLVDLLNEIGKETGFEIKSEAKPWGEVLSDFSKGRYDIIGMFYSPERALKYNLTNSYVNVTHSVFYRRGANPIASIKDLEGKEVLVEVSPVVQNQFFELSPKSKIVQVDHPTHAIELMLKEGYDYAVLPKFMAYFISNKTNSEMLVPTDIIVSTNKYCFAVHKDSTSLLQQLNEGLQIINENGTYLKIYNKWFGTIDEVTFKESKLYQYIKYGILPLIIIVLMIILWNFTLKRQVRNKTIQLQKELEERIKAEQRYQLSQFVIDHSVDCIFGIDRNSKLIYVNDSACSTLGYSREELLNMDVGSIDSSFKKELWEQYWERIKSGEYQELKTVQRKKDKSVILVEGHIFYFVLGEQEFVFAITRDVTGKIKLEESLKKSEELFRNIFENSTIIMYIVDPENLKIFDANKAAIDFYGYSKDEFKDITILDLNHIPETELRTFIKKLKNVPYLTMDLQHYKKNGEQREVTITTTLIKMSDKEYFFTIVVDNTEKNKAIKLLQDSEEKFYKAFMTSPDAININRVSDGLYYDVNDNFLKIMGYSREEVIGKTSLELNIWENMIDRQYLVKELYEKNECVGLESNFVTKDGKIIHGLMSATVIELNGEKCIISITRNITERKKEEIYRQALYKISDAAISTPDFKSLCQRIHSIISDLMPSANLYIALYDHETEYFEYPYFVDEFDDPPQPRKRAMGLTELVIDSGETLLVDPKEFYQLVAEGKVESIGSPSIDWLGAPLKTNDNVIGAIVVQSYTEGIRYNDEHKNILSFVSNQIAMALSQKRIQEELINSNELLEDRVEERTTQLRHANEELLAQVEERLRIESEIRESEERFKLMADSAPVMIWMTDSTGRINYVNDTWISFTGKPLFGVLSDYWNVFIHEDDHDEFLLAYNESAVNKTKFEIRVRLISKTGEYRYVMLSAVPRLIKGDIFHGFIGSGVDITDLHNALEQEKELNSLKTRFISTVSHEYRTPLTTILTSTYLIDTFIKAGNATEATKFLERIQNSVKNMTSLLDQVLTISRSDTGKIAFNPVLTNVYDFCYSFINEIKIVDNKNHNFNLIADDNSKTEEFIDPNLIHQILTNLMTNAMKYSPNDTDIDLTVIKQNNHFEFIVKDSGIGIPKEQLSHLFEPFFRASNVGVIQGTGLGLSIVMRCIDICGGAIEVDSAEGKGTSFKVIIPIKAPEMRNNNSPH